VSSGCGSGNAPCRLWAGCRIVACAVVLALAGCSGSTTPSSPAGSQTPAPSLGPGRFLSAGALAHGRESHSATVLPDGRILIAGGPDAPAQELIGQAEVWDPATRTFSPTGSMVTARDMQTATWLPKNGLFLLAGGRERQGLTLEATASAELYDPETGTFSATGSMAEPRQGQTASLLDDGSVLIAGGYGSAESTLGSAEIYDPKSGTFSSTGSMLEARVGHAATALPDGRVLIVAGSLYPLAELFYPWTGDFSSAGSMAEPRSNATATVLSDGSVLVVGGLELDHYVIHTSAELWVP
jgi:hypothetical protein